MSEEIIKGEILLKKYVRQRKRRTRRVLRTSDSSLRSCHHSTWQTLPISSYASPQDSPFLYSLSLSLSKIYVSLTLSLSLSSSTDETRIHETTLKILDNVCESETLRRYICHSMVHTRRASAAKNYVTSLNTLE